MMTKESILASIPENLQNDATTVLAGLVETLSARGDHDGAQRMLDNLNHIIKNRQKILDDGGDLDYALGRHLK